GEFEHPCQYDGGQQRQRAGADAGAHGVGDVVRPDPPRHVQAADEHGDQDDQSQGHRLASITRSRSAVFSAWSAMLPIARKMFIQRSTDTAPMASSWSNRTRLASA